MKVHFKELQVGSCFFMGNNAEMKKKVSEAKASQVKTTGKVSTRKVKGDPEVESSPCELKFLGVGLRRHPDVMVEIGDGNPFRKGKGKRK